MHHVWWIASRPFFYPSRSELGYLQIMLLGWCHVDPSSWQSPPSVGPFCLIEPYLWHKRSHVSKCLQAKTLLFLQVAYKMSVHVPVMVADLQLCGEERAVVKVVHVQVTPLVVERLYQGLDNTNCVRVVIVDELGLLAVVHTHSLKVSCFAVREHECFDTPGVWLSL